MTHQSHIDQLNATFLWLLVHFLSVEGSFYEPMNL